MKEVSVAEAWSRVYPERVALVTCADKSGKPNIITISWFTRTAVNPPMIAIAVHPTRYSHKLISESKEFVFAMAAKEMGKESLFCGMKSGKAVDKFKETKLTVLPAKKVKAPLIDGCVINLECEVVNVIPTGDHTLFVGEIVAAHMHEESPPVLLRFTDDCQFGSVKAIDWSK